jgi:hypothetical protein
MKSVFSVAKIISQEQKTSNQMMMISIDEYSMEQKNDMGCYDLQDESR